MLYKREMRRLKACLLRHWRRSPHEPIHDVQSLSLKQGPFALPGTNLFWGVHGSDYVVVFERHDDNSGHFVKFTDGWVSLLDR